MNLTKSGIVELTAARAGSPVSKTEEVLKAFIGLIYETLSEGGEVNISGFGKFRMHNTKGRVAADPRNPTLLMAQSGRRTPKFRAGEAFKKAVQKSAV